MRYIGFGTVAAAAVAVAVTLWVGGSSAASDVNKALEKAEKATSVKVRTTLKRNGKLVEVRTITRQGDRIRMEFGAGGATIATADLKTRASLALQPDEKVATRDEISGREAEQLTAMLGDFAGLKATLAADPKAIKAVGEERLGGRETAVFEFASKDRVGGVWKVWVDPKTQFPVRLRLTDEAKQKIVTADYEEWNTKFDAKLFSLDVPEGYKLNEDKK